MSGLFYTVFEYLVWIGLALVLIVLLFVCLAIVLGLSTGVNALAARWRLGAGKTPSQTTEQAEKQPLRSFVLRRPRFAHAKKAGSKSPFGKLHPPNSSSDSKRRAG